MPSHHHAHPKSTNKCLQSRVLPNKKNRDQNKDRWQELKMSKPALETMKEAGQKLMEANNTAETVNNE